MAALGKRSRKGTHHQGTQKRICTTDQKSVVGNHTGSRSTALNSSELETSDYYSFDGTDKNSLANVSTFEASSPLRSSTPVIIESTDNPDCSEYERHGLGKAIDTNKDNPWEHRLPHQLMRVKPGNISERNDGNKNCSFNIEIESQWDFHGAVDASVTAPKIPVAVGISTHFGRSSDSKKQVTGQSIHKCTITLMDTGELSGFAEHIHKELRGRRHPVEHCREILQRKYGGATHYISSITLGAMEYCVREYSRKKTSAKGGGSAGFTSLASVKGDFGGQTMSSETSVYYSKVGRKSEDDVILQEGVVDFDTTPIVALVQDEETREHVTEAVRLYDKQERLKKKGIRGPYSIHSFNGLNGGKKYWKVVSDSGEKVIQLTSIARNRSRFFIEEDDEVGFKITTSDDGEPEEYPRNPQYVQMRKEGGLRLKVDRLTRKDKKVLFQVYDPIKSFAAFDVDQIDWLPDHQSEVGKECYLVPRSGLSRTKKVKRLVSKPFKSMVYCLHFTEQGNIDLVSPDESMKFTLTKV